MTDYLAAPLAFIGSLKENLLAVGLITVLLTAAGHFYAILRGVEESQVERFTAYGFLLGAALGVLFVALVAIFEG